MDKVKAGRENKPHIGIFGRCNTGKSTLLNFITGTDTAIVSPQEGTTTDLVRKSYEIIGFSPVIFIDTGGINDTSGLSARRIARTRDAVLQVDLAIIVYKQWGAEEEALKALLREHGVPVITVRNLFPGKEREPRSTAAIEFDIKNGSAGDHSAFIELIKSAMPADAVRPVTMLGDKVRRGDTVLLVCPIDSEAPAGRMILPQMQAVRETLDRNALAIVIQPDQLQQAIDTYRPSIVITDSQAYKEVRTGVPPEIEVTTFSILLAAAKGDMELYGRGLAAVDSLRDGDRVLIAENCSHQVSCEDIGRVKIPSWLESHTGKKLDFTFVSGLLPLPADFAGFALMVQCGGCMVTRRQLQSRIRQAVSAGVPITNYGMLIKKVLSPK